MVRTPQWACLRCRATVESSDTLFSVDNFFRRKFHCFGNKIGLRDLFDTLQKLGNAEFRSISFHDGFEVIRRTHPRQSRDVKSSNAIFCRSRKMFWSKICFDRVGSRFPQIEGVKPEAGEARRGPRRAK